MKKYFAHLLSGLLAMSLLTPSVVLAEEKAAIEEKVEKAEGAVAGFLSSLFENNEGLEDALFGEEGLVTGLVAEDGPLGSYIPEGIDAGAMLSDLKDQLTDTDSDLYQIGNSVLDSLLQDDGSLDEEALGSMLSLIFAPDSLDDEDFSFVDYDSIIVDYVLAENAGLEQGDVQLVHPYSMKVVEGEDGSAKVLGSYRQSNYRIEGSDLLYVAGTTEDVRLLTLVPEGDTYQVSECSVVSDLAEGADQIAAFLEEIGMSQEEYDASFPYLNLGVPYQLISYLDENPDLERAEYEGELLTSEELSAKGDEIISVLLGDVFAYMDEESEGMEEDVAEEPAAEDAAVEEPVEEETGAEEATQAQ